MKIGEKEFEDHGRTYVMGILDLAPDSLSDGGRLNIIDKAILHTAQMIDEGMDVLDIGTGSSKPGYSMVSDEEELNRLIPVLRAVKKKFDIPVSVDTYKSGVARAAIYEGADMVNDIWGLKFDPNMAKVIADGKISCCLVHNRKDMDYSSFFEDVEEDMEESVRLALDAGIPQERILLDPGVGIAKTQDQDLSILKHLSYFHKLQFPLLLGASRKAFIDYAMHLPEDEREEATFVSTVLATEADYSFVRVHNVKTNRRAVDMTEAIIRAQ